MKKGSRIIADTLGLDLATVEASAYRAARPVYLIDGQLYATRNDRPPTDPPGDWRPHGAQRVAGQHNTILWTLKI